MLLCYSPLQICNSRASSRLIHPYIHLHDAEEHAPASLAVSRAVPIQSFKSNAGRFEKQCDVVVGLFVRNTDSEVPPLFVPMVPAKTLPRARSSSPYHSRFVS